MKTKTSYGAGFTLLEMMTVVAIIGLLAAIAIPNFLRARSTSQMNTCINNLRQIDAAKQEWAMQTAAAATATPTAAELQPYLGRGGSAGSEASFYCPLATTKTIAKSYTIGNMSTTPVCKIVGDTGKYPHYLKP